MTLYEPGSYLDYEGGLAPITTIKPPALFPEAYFPGLPGGLSLTKALTDAPPPAQVPLPLPALVPAAAAVTVPTALGGIASVLGTAATAGAGIYGILQALGLGEGGGLFGLDILGGGNGQQSVGGIPLGGPGLAEPSAQSVIKEWHVNYDWGRLQYYLVQMPSGGRKIALYNTKTKRWKSWAWRAPRLAVIGKNMPSHKMITRLRRNLTKHSADAVTILKMTSPGRLEQHHRHVTRGRPHRR